MITESTCPQEAGKGRAGGLLALLAWPVLCGAESMHTVPYVPSASTEGHAGLVRIESRSEVSGEVGIVAVDDAGQRMDAGALTLGARAAVEFDMTALESGDASRGLTGTGAGEGDWRLELTTELDIEAWAYAVTDGFPAALHDAALVSGEIEMPFFNPGSETVRRSLLRLTNAGEEPATLTVRGVDDAGNPGGAVTVELGAREARSYTAAELESGSAPGLFGALGDGEGKWRLELSAEVGSAYATNLLLDDSGVMSSVPGGMSRGTFHRVSLFPSASDGMGRRGLVRVVNRAADAAEVAIEAFDKTDRAYDRMALTLAAGASGQFGSSDLEQGNAEKGLEGSTGPAEGDWWLELSSASEIEVLPCVDTAAGPLSALRGTLGAETETGMRYEALLRGESGELRLLNAGDEPVDVRVAGVDDAGVSGGSVEMTLAPWTARRLTVTALEEGGEGLTGALGSATGSWRVEINAHGEIDVLSLVGGSGGMLSDVSRRGPPAGSPPRTEVVDASSSRPDLWARAWASSRELLPGEGFDLRATVGNRGAAESAATTLRYYGSADAAIAPSDTELDTDAVSALAAGSSIGESSSLSAPSDAGTYYYGACVDAVADESSAANNCSAAVVLEVTEPPPRSDLVASAALSHSPLDAKDTFTLSATVRNRGGAESAATTLRYYRSADAVITTGDAELGTDAVPALPASGASSESIDLEAPSTPGTYYYGACVEAVADESNTANNCSAAVNVTVRGPPNLDVSGFRSSIHRACRKTARKLDAAVRNSGPGASTTTTLRYYSSTDAVNSSDDEELGEAQVPVLEPMAVSRHSLEVDPSPEARHYYACVDIVRGETSAADNCSSLVESSGFVPSGPDLTVEQPNVNDRLLHRGIVYIGVAVVNRGDRRSASFTTRYYASTDEAISANDRLLGRRSNWDSPLDPGCLRYVGVQMRGFPSGHDYIGVCVDAVAGETNTDNNCSPGRHRSQWN